MNLAVKILLNDTIYLYNSFVEQLSNRVRWEGQREISCHLDDSAVFFLSLRFLLVCKIKHFSNLPFLSTRLLIKRTPLLQADESNEPFHMNGKCRLVNSLPEVLL